MKENRVDLVIPTYRPGTVFFKLLKRIAAQTVVPGHVIIVNTVPNGADYENETTKLEKELEVLNIQGLKLYHITQDAFDHGGTRDFAASQSDAEYVLFMTDDAMPKDKHLVENLLKQMEDTEVAVAYGRQMAAEDSGVLEKFTRVFNYPAESLVKSKEDLKRLGIKTYFCSNVCAMYRKSYYTKEGGFVKNTIFNEDMIMAYHMIQAGHKIAYAADARVIHSHNYTCMQQFHRNFDMGVSQRQYDYIFKSVKSENEGIQLVKKNLLYLIKKRQYLMIPKLIIVSGFKYIGYKAGYQYHKLPMWLVRKCSMNKRYWEKNQETES